MKIQNITIKDIAKALDLSYSTVSRALKGSYKISEPVRNKVIAYANEHNYRPNLLAQSLKNKNSRCIGVVLCNIPNSFFAEVISGIESVAYTKNYLVIITQSHESYEREIQALENLTWRSIDGLLISLSTETSDCSHIAALHAKGLPVVFFDRVSEDFKTHLVKADNEGGAYDLTNHLLHQGYRRIAQITSPAHLSITQERIAGYKKALSEAGQPIDESLIKYCEHGGMLFEEIETAVSELFDSGNPPDAIFAASDRLTLGTLSILKKMGKSIPGDIGMAGFSNFSEPELFEPALTTIKQPAFEMGKTAAELLIQLIESKRPVTEFEKKVFPTELKARASTNRKISVAY
ncbi:LacI family DNA-binding transcriptional regulator [Flavihumibacter stibioxidans]|uniref:LacI family DNA-binding transcriptional regulator n=1 Tax=Flavihumibacter stibioxidans TaxID=1834163 RepID=UPI00164F1FE1|nr:LacI family DNA-binding transcriptional regulator [Flavihumibacter stibioxidans]